MECVGGEVRAIRPSNCAETIDKNLVENGSIAQRLKHGTEQSFLQRNNATQTIIKHDL